MALTINEIRYLPSIVNLTSLSCNDMYIYYKFIHDKHVYQSTACGKYVLVKCIVVPQWNKMVNWNIVCVVLGS